MNLLDRTEIVGDCQVWRGALQSKGYGSVTDGHGHTQLAHRAAWIEAHGPIPTGLTIDHLCCEKRCLNVAHMELVTVGENSRRKWARQTHCKNGHPLSGSNARLYVRPDGHTRRICRECAYEANQRFKGLAPPLTA